MSAENALRAAILSDAAVVALVGDRVARASPVGLEQNPVLPIIGFQRYATIRREGLDGANGLAEVAFLVDFWARTGDAARDLFDAVRLAINCKRFIVAGEEVQKIQIRTDRDLPEPGVELFRVQADVRLWHTEARAA